MAYTLPDHTAYRLTAEDETRIVARIRSSIAAGYRDLTTLERQAANAIGCSTYDLREIELDYVTREALRLLEEAGR